jgi:16S rRNA (cytosine1402-N4)-methyltransferase
MAEGFLHVPVMAAEVTEILSPVPTGLVVDATVGGGGHSGALLAARPDLRLLGIDRDPVAVAAAGAALEPFGERARIVYGGFEEVAHIVGSTGTAGNSASGSNKPKDRSVITSPTPSQMGRS